MGESKTIPNCPCCMRKPCLDGNALEAKCQHIFTGKATGIAAINPDYFTRFDGQEFPVTLNSVYVSWWHGDYSIHGTYWHHNFGHPMSHGCLNASNADALWIYNWDSIGTPVWIHL